MDIWVDEEVDPDEESNLSTGEPYIRIFTEGAVHPTAEQARRVAAMLNDAAHHMEFFEDLE